MKVKTAHLKIALLICFLFIAQWSMAQCKGFAKRADFSELSAFEYCGNIRAAKMYSAEEAKLLQFLEKGRRYRVVIKSQKYLGKVNLSIKNAAGNSIGQRIEEEESVYWEVSVAKAQNTFLILSTENEKSTTGIVSSGCVAVAVGFMENEELVKLQE